jgi:hypothetical protein
LNKINAFVGLPRTYEYSKMHGITKSPHNASVSDTAVFQMAALA